MFSLFVFTAVTSSISTSAFALIKVAFSRKALLPNFFGGTFRITIFMSEHEALLTTFWLRQNGKALRGSRRSHATMRMGKATGKSNEEKENRKEKFKDFHYGFECKYYLK